MKRLLAALLLATAAYGGTPASAQDAEPPAGQAADGSAGAAEAQKELSPETLALALQVVRLSGSSRTFDELLPNIADEAKQAFVRANPQMQLGIIEVVDRVARELVARRPELDTYLAQIWGAAFSDEELQGLIEFYGSDTGKKLAALQNRILGVEMAAAQKWSRDIGRELTDKVTTELRATMSAEQNNLGAGEPSATPAQ